MDTLDITSPAPEVAAKWNAMQDAAMRIARIRTANQLSSLSNPDLDAWLKLQRKDLDEGAANLKEYSQAKPLIENLELRTSAVELQYKTAKSILEEIERTIEKLGVAKVAKGQERFDNLITIIDGILNDVSRIEQRWEALASTIDDEKISKTLKSVARGERPVKQVLSQKMSELSSSEGSYKGSESGPSSVEKKPNENHSTLPVGPGAEKFKKSLGRALSSVEIEHVSQQFFQMLWENGVDQARVGDVLFYQPESCLGMSVYDILGHLNGRNLMGPLLGEFRSKFPSP